ncbi:uncharacterized protein [Rutidosis leptorrhynchoides]|uniref:uncharacterized protein n=1 Tax=Rutidosis leptorrhynchoides TaxID=125765 RepID=UPI003A99BB83
MESGRRNLEELLKAVEGFWENKSFLKGCNASFITLVPKKKVPTGLSDYRPFSLIGSLYKIVAKVLANRLKKVVPLLVSNEQSAFIKGRYIMDSILITNETIDDLKARKCKSLVFKADFAKAFDSLNWKCLIEVLKGMDFGHRWISWIEACLNSGSVSVFVNGKPTNEFVLKKGVRKGDPLAEWKSKLISFGGRLTLIKSVISSLPLYAFSLFRALSGVIDLLKGIRRQLFWSGSGDKSKISWVSWDTILSSYEKGGYNIGSLKAKIFSLLGKWWWRFHKESNSFWATIFKSIYGQDGGLGHCLTNTFCNRGPIWINIQKLEVHLRKLNIDFPSSFVKKVHNGEQTLFWKDLWLGNVLLCEKFNRIFRLDSKEDALVSDREIKCGSA